MALVVLLAIVAIAYLALRLGRPQKERFASPQAHQLYDVSRELFGKTHGGASYSAFKLAAPGADAVQYTDVRRLWTEGKLSPEAVETVL